MTSAAVFGYPDLTGQFALGGGSYSSIYPRSNLLTNDLKAVARTTDATTGSTLIEATCATAQSVGVIMVSTRDDDAYPSLAATWRVRLYSDVAMTVLLLDTGNVTPWPGGKIVRPDLIWWCGAAGNIAGVKGIRINITDTGNPAGYVDFGRLVICGATALNFNFKPGAQRGRRIRSTESEAPGGSKTFGRRPSAAVWRGTFPAIDGDTYDVFEQMWRIYDIDTVFPFIPNPSEPSRWTQSAMLARFVDTGPLATMVALAINEVSVNLEQVL